MDLPARFINHSCDANVGIRDNSLGAFDFVSLTPVARGEELTWVSVYLGDNFCYLLSCHCCCHYY